MEPDDLYGLPFDRFVAERQALAKALRADKRRDEASAVAALRKPSVAAWAVNQLARTQGPAVNELHAAGDALRRAQADLLAGSGDGRALRAANERERAAVDALVERARGLLGSEGQELSATVVERVADTLHAAALDDAAREQVRGGRLERELRFVGLGLGESPAPAGRPAKPGRAADRDAVAAEVTPGGEASAQTGTKAKRAPKSKRDEAQKAAERERRAAERERLEAQRAAEQRLQREREQARKAARAAESAARRHAERGARALRNAEERRDRAAQALDEADEALATAREEARAADSEHERAQVELASGPG